MQQQQHMQNMDMTIPVPDNVMKIEDCVFLEEYFSVLIANDLIPFILFNLYSPDKFVRIRNWHRFSNPVLSGLKVGCQRVNEPVSHLFFINLRSTACGNDGANFLI
jgi:hypothetical protein